MHPYPRPRGWKAQHGSVKVEALGRRAAVELVTEDGSIQTLGQVNTKLMGATFPRSKAQTPWLNTPPLGDRTSAMIVVDDLAGASVDVGSKWEVDTPVSLRDFVAHHRFIELPDPSLGKGDRQRPVIVWGQTRHHQTRGCLVETVGDQRSMRAWNQPQKTLRDAILAGATRHREQPGRLVNNDEAFS